jgi:hypothetical protein
VRESRGDGIHVRSIVIDVGARRLAFRLGHDVTETFFAAQALGFYAARRADHVLPLVACPSHGKDGNRRRPQHLLRHAPQKGATQPVPAVRADDDQVGLLG